VVVVDVPEDVQVERLRRTRAMTEDEARSRIALQAPREKRTGAADLVIDNTGPQDELVSRGASAGAGRRS
jgi:dephospho-CoA kinase